MRKIFYKIFLYFCLAAYLPLALIYAFNFFYVDKYIVEEKRKAFRNREDFYESNRA